MLVIWEQRDIVRDYVQMLFKQHWAAKKIEHSSRDFVVLEQSFLVNY